MEHYLITLPPRLKKIRPKPIFVFGFLYTISFASVLYFNSTIISDTLGASAVATVYSITSLVIIALYIFFPKVLNLYGSYKTTFGLLALNLGALALVGIAATNLPWLGFIGIITHLVIVSLIGLSSDIFIEAESLNQNTGSTRGAFLSIVNIGYVLGPLLGGYVASKFGINYLYVASALTLIPVIMTIRLGMNEFQDPQYSQISSARELINLVINQSTRIAFTLQFSLQIFYAVMVIYTTLFLSTFANLDLDQIGLIMSVILIAFVVTEYPIGKLLDRFPQKYFILAGSSIISLSLFFLSITDSEARLFTWIIILFASRIGAAIIEVTAEASFFRHVDAKDSAQIEAFRLIGPTAYLLVPILAGVIINIYSFQILFQVIGVVIIALCLFALTLQKSLIQDLRNQLVPTERNRVNQS